MNWVGLLAALVVALLLQTAVCPLGDLPLIDIDLLLVLTLLYGLVAPAPDARLSGWLIGLAYDLLSEGPLGLHAVALGLTAWLLTHLRETVNCEVWWVRWGVAALAALPGQALVPLHLRLIQRAAGITWAGAIGSAVTLPVTAGLLATVITIWPPLSLSRRRRRRAPWART